MSFIKKHPFFFLFLLGFLLRFALLFLDFSFDVFNHMTWAKDLALRGPDNFYFKVSSEVYGTQYPNYPPLILVIFYGSHFLVSLIHNLSWWLNLHFPLFPSKFMFFIEGKSFIAGIFKLPAVAADLGIAWLMVHFAKHIAPKEKKLPFLAASLILFNPTFFYNSAYWGQVDAIPLCFTLWSVYTLIVSKRPFMSSMLFLISILLKPTILVFIPLYGVFFVKQNGFKKALSYLGVMIVLFWMSFLPFVRLNLSIMAPFTVFYKQILSAQSLPYITNAAFNFWILIAQLNGIKDTEPFLFGWTYRIWGYLFTAVCYCVILYGYVRFKDKLMSFFYAAFLMAFASFLFLTKMHERYYILPLPFLLLMSMKDRSYLKWFYVVSLLSFLNLYHSWSVPRIGSFVAILTHVYTYSILSIINIATFVLFLRTFILQPRAGKK